MKDLYEIGEAIPDGVIPKKMYAFIVRPESHGEPLESFKQEVIDIPEIGHNEVLVKIMAAGINYNGVWSALGKPYSPSSLHKHNFHIAGSDASGIVWKIGDGLKSSSFSFKVGDPVIIHCGQYCGLCIECNGGDQMLCSRQKIWGYETPYGSFAQFTKVQPQQLLHKPKHLTWAESSSYMLVLATAWRMLHGYPPNHLRPSQNILIMGASGGLGSMAIQIVKNSGANAIAVVSNKEKGEYCMKLGAIGYIDRNEFDCWGKLPNISDEENYKYYLVKLKRLAKTIWEITGNNNNPDIVFEHTGEETFPVSCYLAKKGGMVVYCGATSGFYLTMDASYGWMHQKRIQGSHFASTKDAYAANNEVINKKINPTLSKVFHWADLPKAHQIMYEKQGILGKMSVLVQANNDT